MDELAKHKALVKRPDKFQVKCSHSIFNMEEIELLERYGHWYEGLASGYLTPLTEKQVHFVKVAQNQETPQTPEEKAWFKYQGRRRLEADPDNRLDVHYELQDDTFYSRDMVQRLRATMSSVTWKNHRQE